MGAAIALPKAMASAAPRNAALPFGMTSSALMVISAFLSILMGTAAAALSWKPLVRIVTARADLKGVIVSVATAVIGAQYVQTSALEAKLEAKLDKLSEDVRDGMRRVDAFAEAAVKVQLLWDAAQVKAVPTAKPFAHNG